MAQDTETLKIHYSGVLLNTAKSRLRRILSMIEVFNNLTAEMREMGYTHSQEGGMPFPQLELINVLGCVPVDDASIVDEYYLDPPIKQSDATRRRPIPNRAKFITENGCVCFYCGNPGDQASGPDSRAWHVDHAYPLSLGGDHGPDNLVLSCATCNLEKKARTAADYFKSKSI